MDAIGNDRAAGKENEMKCNVCNEDTYVKHLNKLCNNCLERAVNAYCTNQEIAPRFNPKGMLNDFSTTYTLLIAQSIRRIPSNRINEFTTKLLALMDEYIKNENNSTEQQVTPL